MPSQPAFQFNRRRGLENESIASTATATTATTTSDIHPVELVVQSIIGPSLEALSGKLQQLQESQFILTARLRTLEKKLSEYDANISIVNTNALTSRISVLQTRLNNIIAVLKTVEKRIQTNK